LKPNNTCESVENIDERAQKLMLLVVVRVLELDSLMSDSDCRVASIKLLMLLVFAQKGWASKVLEGAGICRRLLRIVHLIRGVNPDKVIVIAVFIEVTAAERFKSDLG
jgi:hypothetical protein